MPPFSVQAVFNFLPNETLLQFPGQLLRVKPNFPFWGISERASLVLGICYIIEKPFWYPALPAYFRQAHALIWKIHAPHPLLLRQSPHLPEVDAAGRPCRTVYERVLMADQRPVLQKPLDNICKHIISACSHHTTSQRNKLPCKGL